MTSTELNKWLRANLGSSCLAPLTSTDSKALIAAVAIIELYAYDASESLLDAFGKVVMRMQPSTRHLAYHAIASVKDWHDRDTIWNQAGMKTRPYGRCKFEPLTQGG